MTTRQAPRRRANGKKTSRRCLLAGKSLRDQLLVAPVKTMRPPTEAARENLMRWLRIFAAVVAGAVVVVALFAGLGIGTAALILYHFQRQYPTDPSVGDSVAWLFIFEGPILLAPAAIISMIAGTITGFFVHSMMQPSDRPKTQKGSGLTH